MKLPGRSSITTIYKTNTIDGIVEDAGRDEKSSLSVIAHELRTPLTSVLGLFALLEDGSVRMDEDEGRELAAMGRSEAERMLLIVENLLLATKLAQGKLDPQRQPVDLPGVIRGALDDFPEVALRAYVPLDRRAVVSADRHLVSQIITNLVQNVHRYAPTGEVETRFDYREGMVELSVADDGPGVTIERREEIFGGGPSERGLGLGLGISRDLARAMGGDLVIRDEPLRSGATFTLALPMAVEGELATELVQPQHTVEQETIVLAPSARLLVDMTDILADRSLDRLVAGLHKMFSGLLDAEAGLLMVRDRAGELRRAGSFGAAVECHIEETQVIKEVLSRGIHEFVADLAATEPIWAEMLTARSGLFLPVLDDGDPIGVLVIGWDRKVEPSPRLIEIAGALARLAAFGAQRAALAAEVVFERQVRFSVLESLPIAISVFAGDPPRLVDCNDAERRMLGLESDEQRPTQLASSQQAFDVRFLDGTPLTIDNAPVVTTIKAGQTQGPFYLRVRRADGTELISRTYCAPFFGEDGTVAGAVVTSEEVDQEAVDLPLLDDHGQLSHEV
ncbi:MAG TPA: ATP-binding protein [Acidimicrobiia bacterium]|nr:ATP-binding protein [Acidimicrobiia bacterium]